jgi:hypothetical protein
MLTVTVVAAGQPEVEVKSLEELFMEIRKYDPSVYVYVQFLKDEGGVEETVSVTVDP